MYMDIEKTLPKEKKNNAIDMLVTLIVGELSEEMGIDPDTLLPKFLSSKTGELLYDDDSKLWWNGPSYIADMYKKEVAMLK